MMCEECGKNPASVHLAKIINGEKTEKHLCEGCAKEIGDIGLGLNFEFEPNFSIHNLLSGLLDSSKETPVGIDFQQKVKCDKCEMSFNQFSKVGRFGCSNCYEAYPSRILPILKRIHGGSYHTGKVPKKAGVEIRQKREIEDLKKKLRKAVQLEKYEDAAKLRDRIKELEGKMKSE